MTSDHGAIGIDDMFGSNNYRKIVGIRVAFVFDITDWRIVPTIGLGLGAFHWLCFRSWWDFEYKKRGGKHA